MFCSISGCTLSGASGALVRVETTLSNGLPNFYVVGLPDSIVRESKERIRSALQDSGFSFPSGRITVNLAPAHLKKIGSALDFPIAASILCAEGLLPQGEDSLLSRAMLLGELSLNGELRPVPGALAMAAHAKDLILLVKGNALYFYLRHIKKQKHTQHQQQRRSRKKAGNIHIAHIHCLPTCRRPL